MGKHSGEAVARATTILGKVKKRNEKISLLGGNCGDKS